MGGTAKIRGVFAVVVTALQEFSGKFAGMTRTILHLS
jgi:hypothetical protein